MPHGLFKQCPSVYGGGQKALVPHPKYLNYRFGTTWGWVINDRIFIFGWVIPLNNSLSLKTSPAWCVSSPQSAELHSAARPCFHDPSTPAVTLWCCDLRPALPRSLKDWYLCRKCSVTCKITYVHYKHKYEAGASERLLWNITVPSIIIHFIICIKFCEWSPVVEDILHEELADVIQLAHVGELLLHELLHPSTHAHGHHLQATAGGTWRGLADTVRNLTK